MPAFRDRSQSRLRASSKQHEPDDLQVPEGEVSYLLCVECSALYEVEPEELEGPPRVVSCSACLHEWYATEADLLWGEEQALEALNADNSFEARSRRKQEEAALKAASVARQPEQNGMSKGSGPSVNGRALRGGIAANQEREETPEATAEPQRVVAKAKDPPQEDRSASRKSASSHEDGENGAVGNRAEERFTVFVGNLSFRATKEDLYRAFSGYGAVLRCDVPADASGMSRGYGFVEMRSRESALRAIESLQGTSIMGRDICLNEARPRRESVEWKRAVNGRASRKGHDEGKRERRVGERGGKRWSREGAP